MSDTPATIETAPASEATEEKLRATIARLLAEGHLTETEAARMQRDLSATLKNSAYILRHLGVHWAMAAIFAVDFVPLLGTISRVVWVAGNRVVETCCGRWDRASVHSLPVLGIAAIPWVGYFAYLIPLRARSPDAAFLYANHFTYSRSNCALPTYLERRPKWIGWMVRKVVVAPGGQAEVAGSSSLVPEQGFVTQDAIHSDAK